MSTAGDSPSPAPASRLQATLEGSTGKLSTTPNPSGLATTTAIPNLPLLLGDAGLSFSAPGAGNTGHVDLSHDLRTEGVPWLLFDWDSDGSNDDDPTARVTFGVFKGHDAMIYSRELY